jgi:hypothetical protein
VNGTRDHSPICNRIVDGEPQRFCKMHQGWWPLRLFVRHPQGQGGYLGYCRACRNGARKRYSRDEAAKGVRKAYRRERYRYLTKCLGMKPSETRKVL